MENQKNHEFKEYSNIKNLVFYFKYVKVDFLFKEYSTLDFSLEYIGTAKRNTRKTFSCLHKGKNRWRLAGNPNFS